MTINKQTAPHQVLDPSLLGRPVHRLPAFAAQLKEDLAQAMRLDVNRRYWGTFQIDSVAFSRLEAGSGLRWTNFTAPAGTIAFSLERKVLLAVLNYRYGRAKSNASADEAAVKVTATEQRLAVVLGQQLAGTLAARIESNLPALDKFDAGQDGFKPAEGALPVKGDWIIGVTVSDPESVGDIPLSGRFVFALDKNLMVGVLRGLRPEREQARRAVRNQQPLAARLQVGLQGRLVSKEMQLGNLFDLRVGDVIPISMHRAEVLLDDSRLFTAAVSEHKGKLCLTSFEDAE